MGMCALLMGIIHEVAGLVDAMRDDEGAIRQGIELSTSVRELVIEVGAMVIEGDASTSTYAQQRDRVRSAIQRLSARVPPSAREHLEALGHATQRMHALVVASILPALQRGDSATVAGAYREVQRLAAEAAQHADRLSSVTTREMAHAHDHATLSTQVGLMGGGLCVVLIVLLSIAFTFRLRAVVLRPLDALTRAALRYGQGDFAAKVEDLGEGELLAVGRAFSRMADELARREARLLHNERMATIGQLAAGIAHELNNPIGIIRGYLKTMSPDEDPETLREELSILDEEASHCQRIADDLLAYARSEELTRERVPMRSFLIETARRYAVSAKADGVDVHVDVEVDAVAPAEVNADPDGVGASAIADDIEVEVDGARLRQVVLNLLRNAGQASPPGASIQLRGRRRGAAYQIEVEDRGPGVDLGDRARVFEPFFSKRKGGSGLGLAVCQGIIKAHGGSIDVLDGEGGGAVFRVVVPLRASVPGEEADER